ALPISALVIMQGRAVIDNPVNWLSLLIPRINLQALLYNGYGIGFTAIALISLIGSYFIPKKEIRFITITLSIILIIPLFCYLLNGMLYARVKSLIPFMPLVGLVMAIFLTAINNNEINAKKLIIGIVIFFIFTLLIGHNIEYHYYLDLIITTIIIIWSIKKQKIKLLYVFIIMVAFLSSLLVNINESLVNKEIYNNSFNNKKMVLITNVVENDQSFYRMNDFVGNESHTVNKVYNARYYQTSIYSSTYNKNYHQFFYDVIMNAVPYRNNLLTTQSNNIMFQTLMGVKYIISDNEAPVGYELINSHNKLKVYKNDDVFPLGYVSSSLLSNETLNQLSFPYKSEALINNIIINNKDNNEFSTKINEIELAFNYEIGDNISINEDNGIYIIDVKETDTINLELLDDYSDQIIFIEFILQKAPNCSDGDISITINDVTNKLTCKQWLYFNENYQFQYTLSNNNKQDYLNLKFSKGHFEISDIKIYSLDYKYVANQIEEINPFIVDLDQTIGDTIIGNIEVTRDGYFATTIPYDEGFTVLVNNEKIKYEKVNQAFIGFPLKKGNYKIKITYQAPGYKSGLLLSEIGFGLFIIDYILTKRKKVKK
ncbi:MAG: YfhO family protein, partial [Bacilli bacterium]|nr:YfhO family protein [Bacilli bacterium]